MTQQKMHNPWTKLLVVSGWLVVFLFLTACTEKEMLSPSLDLAEINSRIEKSNDASVLLEQEAGDQEVLERPLIKDIIPEGQGGNSALAMLSHGAKYAPGSWEQREVERMKVATQGRTATPGSADMPGVPETSTLDGAAPQGPADGLQLNFDNADIYEVIQVIGSALGMNYLIDPQVKGTVNIRSGQAIPADQLFVVFQKILHMNGLDIRREGSHNYIFVSKKPYSQQINGPQDVDDLSPSSRLILQVIPIQHLPSAQAMKLIEKYLSEQGSVVNLPEQNTLLISDYEGKIIDVLSILARLDISPLADMYVRLIRVENAPLYDLRDELSGIMEAFRVNKKNFEPLRIIPLERLSSLLLVSKNEFLVNNGEIWIRELDVVPGMDRDNIYIYNARNTVASELAELVNTLIREDEPVAKKATSNSMAKDRKAPPRNSKKKGNAPQSSLRFAGNPILFADDTRNVILIRSLPPDYARIVKLLERLDTLPRQVLVEVMVAEVLLKDELQMGVQWAAMNNYLGWNGDARVSFDVLSPNLGSGYDPGLSLVFNSGDSSREFLRALAGKSDLSILSSPQVLVLNNETATVNVGEQIPIVTSITENSSAATQVDKTVQYKDTGVILEVTPQINYDGIILLEVKQTVSTALDIPENGVQSQPIKTRELKTKLAVKDGQSIMIGGLIGTDININNSGIPLLKDIPWLGYFFKYESREKRKTELIVMLTPYVIETEDVLDQYVREFGGKMSELRQEMNADIKDLRPTEQMKQQKEKEEEIDEEM